MISLRQRPRCCSSRMLTKDHNTFPVLRCFVVFVVVLCYSPLPVSGDVFAKIAASKTTPPATPPAKATTTPPATTATRIATTPTTTPASATIAAPTLAPTTRIGTTPMAPAIITATPVATSSIAPTTAAPNNFGFLPCSICGGDNWSRFVITKPQTVIPVDLLSFLSAGTTCADVNKLAINSNLSPPNCQSLVRQQPILSSICGCSVVLLPISTTIRIQWNSVSELLSVGVVPTYKNVLASFLQANLDIAFSFVRSVSLLEQVLLLDDNYFDDNNNTNTTNSSSSCCLYPLNTVINVTIDYDPMVALNNDNFTLSNVVPYFTNGIVDVLQRKQNVLINSLQSVDTMYFSNIASLTATSPTLDTGGDDDDDIGSNRTVQPTLRGTTMAPTTTVDAPQPSFAPAALPTVSPPIASQNTASNNDSSSKRISGGAITGIVIAVLILVLGLITCFNIYTKNKRQTETIIIMESDFFNGSTINNALDVPKTGTQLMEENSNSNSSSNHNNNNDAATAKSAASSLADMEQSYIAAPIVSSNNNEVVVSTTSTSSTVSSSSAVPAATAIITDTNPNLLTTTKLQEKQLDDNEEPDVIVDDYNFSKTEESRLVSENDEGDATNNMNAISDDKSEDSYLMSDDNEDASAASSVEPTAVTTDVPDPVPVGFGDAAVEKIMATIVETSGSSYGSSFAAPKRIRKTPWDDIKESKEDAPATEPVVETASTRDGATAALALAATKATTTPTTTKSKVGGNASSSSSLFAAFSSASYLHVDPKTMARRTIVAPSGKLGIVIDTTLEGPVIHKVKSDSPLQGLLYPGDIIINVDGIDTRAMSAGAITALMIKTANHERNMTILYNKKE